MPTPRPRHLARARRPWRLLLVAFGLTTAVLAALVASATLLPQPEPPRRAPGVALPTATTEPAPTSTSLTTSTTTEPTTAPSPPTSSPDTNPSAASRPITMGGRHTTSATPRWSNTTVTSTQSTPGATTQPPVTTPSTTAPTTTAASTTTAALSTTTEPTTTLLTTTTAEPTTTGPTTTSTGPTTTSTEPTTTGLATTTTSPVILGGTQPAGVSAATVGGLLPLLGLLYLLRGHLPRLGGAHAKQRRNNHLRRD
jgi:hypothetical protein